MTTKTVFIVFFIVMLFVFMQITYKLKGDIFPLRKYFIVDNFPLKMENIISFEQLKTSSCKNKTKFMFSKNSKTGGTTVSSIIAQIAIHYHKYEILECDEISHYLPHEQPNIGYHFTYWGLEVPKFKKRFPKRETLWISTVRNVPDQVNSLIRFFKLEDHYYPANFSKTLEKFKQEDGSGGIVSPFVNGGISILLDQCVRHHNLETFKVCAENVSREFDLIIPIKKLNEGLIMLHKYSCLPLSDFPYMTKKKLEQF